MSYDCLQCKEQPSFDIRCLTRRSNGQIDLGDEVTIRGTIIRGVLNWYIETVKKSDVVKIQLAGNYVTLFNKIDG
jgi:hypothetical protein